MAPVRRLLLLFLLLCVGLAGAGIVAAQTDRRPDVPGVDLPAPGRVVDEVLDRADPQPSPRRATCPGDVPDCRAVRGRIVFVERVDPDGDGDLHVVVADGSITAPGLTSIDVRPGLRPRRDPGIGDVATAAGPVQRGSKNQAQIHALTFRVAER